MEVQLPENVKKLKEDELFSFACDPSVKCFTDCCRELELALTPYDVLRLKNKLQMTSVEFLKQYIVIEAEMGQPPRFYLGMVDDGRASCPFVSAAGCEVYDSRPGSCRAYPVGRAASLAEGGSKKEFHVLLSEPHCHGFDGSTQFTAKEWTSDQELDLYNEFNDDFMGLLQHPRMREGFTLSREQIQRFTLSLYNLDRFRAYVTSDEFTEKYSLKKDDIPDIKSDDSALLRYAIRWLKKELFGSES